MSDRTQPLTPENAMNEENQSYEIAKHIADDLEVGDLYALLCKSWAYCAPAEDPAVKRLILQIYDRFQEAKP